MKRIKAILIIILFSLIFTATTKYWFYIRPLKIMSCKDDNCWHEIAHAYDYQNNQPSQTDAFRDAVEFFIEEQMQIGIIQGKDKMHPMAAKIILFPGIKEEKVLWKDIIFHQRWGGEKELYAEIIHWAKGNPDKVPIIFRPYYDFQAIQTTYYYFQK